MRRAIALALALALLAPPVVAQELRANLLVPWPVRNDAVHTVVAVAAPRTPGTHELRAHLRRFWPTGEVDVALTANLGGRARTLSLPAPFGPNDDGVMELRPEGTRSQVGTGNPGNPRNGTPGYIAVLGLGAGRAAEIDNGSSESEVVAGLVARSPESATLFAPLPLGWGGAQAIVTDAATLIDAPTEARTNLADWVHAGGILAISPRDANDLRPAWMRALVGDAALDDRAQASGPDLRPAHTFAGERFGAARALGLGTVVVLDGDLSLEGNRTARLALQGFRNTLGPGGGLVPPGDLSLWRRVDDHSVQRALRGPSNLRPALVPIALALTLYVVAVGLVLSRNRARRNPLRVFVRIPVAGLVILATVFGLSVALRAHRSAARIACVWDLGVGSRRAVLRRFGAITAARPQSFSLRPGAGEIALVRGSAASASGTLRWDGTRLSIEGARLGLWETALLYTEGVVDAGGAFEVLAQEGRVTLVNQTTLALRDPVLLTQGSVLRLPAIPPGARVEASLGDAVSLRPQQPFVAGVLQWRDAPLLTTVLEEILGDLRAVRDAQIVARAELDPETRAIFAAAGFPVTSGEALVRVVIPARPSARIREPVLARNRVGARNWGANEEPTGTVVPPNAGDAGGDAP